MSRIFKGSESTLRLLVGRTNEHITNLKITLYTTDANNSVVIEDGIVFENNIATIPLSSRALLFMDDGVLNYKVEGEIDGDVFSTTRQSNYFVKTLPYIDENGIPKQEIEITSNGEYEITPNDGAYITIRVNVDASQYYDVGVADGRQQVYDEAEEIYIENNGTYEGPLYKKVEVNIDTDSFYNDGYNNGQADGFNQGREDIINQAEDLYLTENGVYEGENLYKRVEVAVDVEAEYNKGYEDATNAASADAVVLDVTENGTVYTKFAEVPEWTEPLTGDDFYSYAKVESIAYKTQYTPNFDTKVEFWWRKSGTLKLNVPILGITYFGVFPYFSNFYVSLNGTPTYFDINDDNWHHFQLSMKDGFWMDGVQIATYTGTSTNITNAGPIMINGEEMNILKNIGDFGMIKIDDNIIIPTYGGFKDLNNNELLEMYTGAGNPSYTFVQIEKPAVLNNLIKQVNVNAIIDVAKEKLKFSYSTFEKTPDYLDFSKVVDMSYMFSSNKNLKDLSNIKDWDTSKVTNMSNMFGSTYCPDFSAIKDWNVSNVTNMSYMFTINSNITDFSFLSNWDTSKVTNMSNMLNVSSATDLPAIDCTSVGYNKYPITLYSNNTKLVNVGGFLNMRSKWDDSYGLSKLPNLTYESCINILNGLYDFTGQTPTSNEAKLKVHANFLTTVGDDINIGISKNWTITA